MRTSKSQMMWAIRILLFPMYFWALHRKEMREIIEAKQLEAKQLEDAEFYKPIVKDGSIALGYRPARKQCAEVESYWQLQILDKRGCILGQETGRMVDEEKGLIVYGDFDITAENTVHKSRVLRRNKIVGTCPLPNGPLHVTEHDLLKIRYLLKIDTAQPEPIHNAELRQCRLMTANSRYCKEGVFPINEFALIDNGDLESLGAELRLKFVKWYPKAIWFKEDGSTRTSYDMNSALFQDIKKKTRPPQGMWGIEVVWELSGGELVTMFFGTQSMRREMTNLVRETGYEHIITVQHMTTKQFNWSCPKITAIAPVLWMGQSIESLDDKHLWNIVQAVKKKEWASGAPARFEPVMRNVLLAEYQERKADGHYNKKKVKKIKKANEKYDKAHRAND